MNVTQDTLSGVLRVLADDTRLRILALLARSELSVGELARCLAMGQSRVSNHLKILREHGVISERHEGSYTYCRLDIRLDHGRGDEPGNPDDLLASLWPALEPALQDLAQGEADRRRLAGVLTERGDSRAFFDRIAGDWDLIGSDFSQGTGRLEALGCLVPAERVVADVGCGTGYLARALARHVARVICVDASPAMLAQARENLADLPADVEFRQGELESLPLDDGEVDAACAHMVLHHLTDLRPGIAEMARVVRPGGDVVIVDLLPHTEAWMREDMADARLGLEPAELEAACRAIGLQVIARRVLADSYKVEPPAGRKGAKGAASNGAASHRPARQQVELPLQLVHARKPLPTESGSRAQGARASQTPNPNRSIRNRRSP